jgi:hypothetical protein
MKTDDIQLRGLLAAQAGMQLADSADSADSRSRRGPVQTIRELPSCRTYTGGWSRR